MFRKIDSFGAYFAQTLIFSLIQPLDCDVHIIDLQVLCNGVICGDCPSEAFVSAAGPTARPSPSTSGTAPRLQPGNARLFRLAGARLLCAGADCSPTRGRRSAL